MGRPKKDDGEVDFTDNGKFKDDPANYSQEEIDQYNAEAKSKIIRLYGERDEITAKINEVRAGVKAMGTPKGEFDAAVKDSLMDEDARIAKDKAYFNCRRAFGIPIEPENWTQPDMLGGPDIPLAGKDAAAEQSATVQ